MYQRNWLCNLTIALRVDRSLHWTGIAERLLQSFCCQQVRRCGSASPVPNGVDLSTKVFVDSGLGDHNQLPVVKHAVRSTLPSNVHDRPRLALVHSRSVGRPALRNKIGTMKKLKLQLDVDPGSWE